MAYHTMQNVPTEWSFSSSRTYADPFNDVTLDVVFTDPDGDALRVPTFWSGENGWRVRFAPRKCGTYRWKSVCSEPSDDGLHAIEGALEVAPYDGANPLYRHGPIQISRDGRHFEHLDGTPFFWLGDTWWMGLCRRLGWPGDFQHLTADRVAKGFSVVQIVAGLYPDMPAFDERGANEAGFPWEPEWARIRPDYFDMADLRIHWLVRSGIVPCIVGCWGYYVHWLGIERMKRHWRELVARYGAYPVVWCLCGEVLMPYYRERLSTPEAREAHRDRTRAAWSEVAALLREVDPDHHPLTVHPGGGQSARDSLDDALIDFDMLQTGHNDRASLPRAVDLVVGSRGRTPTKPVVNGEPCYEGIGEAGREEVQRLLFWTNVLSGAAGHTYGANGLWQVNTLERPYGPSPHGTSWGDTPWEVAHELPGSRQLGIGKSLLERYRWWEFEPHPEWVDPHWTEKSYMLPYASGIPGAVRVIFTPSFVRLRAVRALEADTAYRAFYFNPKNGREVDLGEVHADDSGVWNPPPPPIFQDWVLVLEAV